MRLAFEWHSINFWNTITIIESRDMCLGWIEILTNCCSLRYSSPEADISRAETCEKYWVKPNYWEGENVVITDEMVVSLLLGACARAPPRSSPKSTPMVFLPTSV